MRFSRLVHASLLALTFCGSAPAFATCDPDTTCGQSYHYEYAAVVAALALNTSVNQNAQGSWDYVYTLSRTGNETGVNVYLNTLKLPTFVDAQITDLSRGPESSYGPWTLEIVPAAGASGEAVIESRTDDSYYWNTPWAMANLVQEIRFTSPFAPGPQATATAILMGIDAWGDTGYGGSWSSVVIDPPPALFSVTLPGSPLAIAASVPEPGAALLWLCGMPILGAIAARGRGARRTRR